MADFQALLAKLTTFEKAALCTGDTAWTTTAIERLGIPALVMADGPHGVRRVTDNDSLAAPSLPATCFPTASALAATWDIDLVRQVGAAIAEEAIAQGVDVVLGPSNNMKRSPLCGRNFEYYAEDPYLSGELAVAFIDGVQGKGVGTSLKHFAANNQEFQRFSIDTLVDERTLREIYLPAFETAVKRAQPWTVMCAYNKLNGRYCSEHHELLVAILKKEWGFQGLVVSDWGAVHDRVASLAGGLDLEMPGPKPRRTQAVIDALHSGDLEEDELNEAARRILGVVEKAAATPKGAAFDQAAHHALARQVAGESMVLLKNNGILPLTPTHFIAVIGHAAQAAHYQGGGSSHINPTAVDNPLVELQQLAGDAEISYAAGYPADESFQPALIEEAVTIAATADVALLYIALPGYKESEGYDRADLDLTPQQVALIQAVSRVQGQTVVILNNGAAVTVDPWIDGVGAVLEAWMMGQAGGGAIADVLFGKVNPSGKLAETFPQKLADTPAYLNFPGGPGRGGYGEVRYGEGIFIGYRYYDAKQVAPRFPFGYGLSYTTFAYGGPQVSATSFRDVDGVSVSVAVTNTGTVAGKEIVQLYVHDHASGLVRPPKELKGFAKVALDPGETKTVTMRLDFRAFAYYHPAYGKWITEDGDFDLLVGASAGDIRGQVRVTLQSTVQLPCILNYESTLREWLADTRGQVVIGPLIASMTAQFTATVGMGEEGNADGGMDLMGFLMDLPLRSILHFQESALPAPADEMVDDLLAEVRGR